MDANTAIERQQRSANRRDMLAALVGYVATLIVVLGITAEGGIEGPGEWALLMLPILPALWGVRGVVRHLRRVDEYQRLLQLEAMAAGFGVAMVTSVSLGLASSGGTAAPAPEWIVYGAGMFTWGVVATVQGRRR